jgi:ATP-dependent protease ClpP protease subunit
MSIFKKSAVEIRREHYAMAMPDGENAEITLYGDIVNERPTHWWTDELLDGDYIVAKEFLEDFKSVQNASKITLRINSLGGDAYAAITIHNRIRESKAEITAIVDGVAMSGGSLIMCAADKVVVNPSSLIMIHRCMSILVGYYNADDLREAIASNDAVDKAQAAIYSRKTGLDEAALLSMMGDTTYMTGTEALEKGFADELSEETRLEIAASADCKTIYVNGRPMRLTSAQLALPDSIPMVKSAPADEINKLPSTDGEQTQGGNPTMANTLEELRTENPSLADALVAEAQTAASASASAAERERLAGIDAIASLYDPAIVHEAKYGEKPCSAQELAYRAALDAQKAGTSWLANAQADAAASGAKDITAVPPAAAATKFEDMTEEQRFAVGAAAAKALREKGGVKNG